MRRIAVGDKPPFLDRPAHGSLAGLVIQAQSLGNLVHGHPMTGSTATYPHDVLVHGAGGIL